MKIQKELRNEAVKQRKSIENMLTASPTQRLLTQGGAEDIEMLKQLGMHTHAMQLVQAKGKQMDVANLDTKYGQVFTEDEIKKIACKYALRFLRTDHFKGPVDSKVTQKIREFHNDYKLEMNQLQYKVYVLAPYSSFQEGDRKPVNPIIFYKLDEGVYRLIHQWDDNLSLFRQLIGWKYDNFATFWWFWVFITTASWLLIAGWFTQSPYVLIIPTILLNVFTFVRAGILSSNDSNQELFYMGKIWDKSHKNAY